VRFLQASDPGAVWRKSISAKPQECAMSPTLISLSGGQYRTMEGKIEAISRVLFPTRADDLDEALYPIKNPTNNLN
jgi:hypothetical protein